MYAIVNKAKDEITVVHTRETQEQANELAVEIVVEQEFSDSGLGWCKNPPSKQVTDFKARVLSHLQEYGVYVCDIHDGWDVTVIEVSTTRSDHIGLTPKA